MYYSWKRKDFLKIAEDLGMGKKFANSMAFVLSLVRTIKIRLWITGKCYLGCPKIWGVIRG